MPLSASVIGAGSNASQKGAVELKPDFLVHTLTNGSAVAKKRPDKATENKNRGLLARLGPGLITVASDDDPSGMRS